MKRILLLTGILVLAFTATAFADTSDDTDSTTASLTVGSFFNIDAPSTATHALTESELESGSVEFDAGTDVQIDANTDYKITATYGDLAGTTGEAVGHTVDLDVRLDAVDGFVESGTNVVLVTTNAPGDNVDLDLDFRCESLTFANVAPGSYAATVTFTIAAD